MTKKDPERGEIELKRVGKGEGVGKKKETIGAALNLTFQKEVRKSQSALARWSLKGGRRRSDNLDGGL